MDAQSQNAKFLAVVADVSCSICLMTCSWILKEIWSKTTSKNLVGLILTYCQHNRAKKLLDIATNCKCHLVLKMAKLSWVFINNAGTQNDNDIDTNLKALIKITEKYGIQKNIKSILNIGSASGHTGSEFPEYCASKGGVIAYTKNVALRVAEYGATCNSLDPGGVVTPLNRCVMEDQQLWKEIMDQTPLKRWAKTEEIACWAYFLTVENTFCTGQSIIVDGGESINSHFVWPKDI